MEYPQFAFGLSKDGSKLVIFNAGILVGTVAVDAVPPAFSTYLRPDGVSSYLRPDGVSSYLRP